tara:strand:+ start:69 stop:1214 length:1146 start_codon:yes stop_codon:yes gene_type:complete
MNRKVLDRPMFARMRDSSIKPVQYAQAGLFIQGASKALPYVPRGLAAIKNTLPAIISGGKNLITKGKSLITGGGGGAGTAVGPYLGGPASTLTKSKIPFWKLFGAASAPAAVVGLSDMIGPEEKEEKKPYKPHKPNMLDVAGPKKVEKEDKVTEEVITDINKGNLDEMITEKIDLFKEKLGSGKGRMKTAGFGLLTEIGLNLMQAKGGNFLDKLSRSATDPLKTFTKIGQAINDRMDKITMAGIESGVKSFEADKDRALTREQIEQQAKPDDVRTLEYLQQLPGIKGLPIEQVIRLSKNKAIMSDQEFYQELALNLTRGDPNITSTEIEAIFNAIKAGSPGGGETMTIEEQITILKGQDKTDSEIKEALIAIGEDPSKYGY